MASELLARTHGLLPNFGDWDSMSEDLAKLRYFYRHDGDPSLRAAISCTTMSLPTFLKSYDDINLLDMNSASSAEETQLRIGHGYIDSASRTSLLALKQSLFPRHGCSDKYSYSAPHGIFGFPKENQDLRNTQKFAKKLAETVNCINDDAYFMPINNHEIRINRQELMAVDPDGSPLKDQLNRVFADPDNNTTDESEKNDTAVNKSVLVNDGETILLRPAFYIILMLERTFVNTNPAPDLSDQLWHTYGFGQSLSELSQAQKGRMTAQTDEYKRLEKLAPHDGQAAAMVNHVNAWPIRVGRAAVGMMDAFTRLKLDGAIATTKQLIGTPTGAMLQQRH